MKRVTKLPKKGIFPFYKPIGPSSFDLIRKVRAISGEKKVGHAGTLDPLAEGLLLVACGRQYTKKLSELKDLNKVYEVEIYFGLKTKSDDREFLNTCLPDNARFLFADTIPSEKDIKEYLKKNKGFVLQQPPAFSAIKVKGKRAYALARKGEKVGLKEREVLIKDIDLLSYNFPYLKLKLDVGSGFYVRSFARDIGNFFKIGAYMSALKRLQVGDYKLDEAFDVFI